MKLTSCCLIGLAVVLSSATFAADQSWQGQFSNIMPTHAGVTEEFCKAHVLDTYKTTANMVDKTVKADNGVEAKEMTFKMKPMGGVYAISGTAMLSGMTDNKPWKEKASYFAYSLQPKDGMQQGVWYTKDCKGFYKVGPAE